jgi:hypothetical protein
VALFGKKESPEVLELREQLEQAHGQIADLQGWVHQLRGAGSDSLEKDLRELRTAVQQAQHEESRLRDSAQETQGLLEQLQSDLVETREMAILQEVGVYEYAHPLEDALAYKDALDALKVRIRAAAKADAVSCQVDWAVNGSVKEGQKLGRDIARLMLRAYNTEADNAVRSVKPHTRDAVKNRLTKTRDTIGKLGALLHIAISADYHRLRLEEVDLTADYLMRVEVEKEEARAERERLREEAKVMKEIERERARLAKERSHYMSALAKLETGDGDPASVERLRQQLAELDEAVESVEARAANIRAGYVYVISNIGAFGQDMVKIGMTRRLEPMDRVRELGDASVPFRFDTHALFFSDDAVALEGALHDRFADRRVNMVNMRREFFYATPAEVKTALVELGNEHILEYNDDADAVEWRASDPSRRQAPASTDVGKHRAPDLVTVGAHSDSGVDGDLSDDGDA